MTSHLANSHWYRVAQLKPKVHSHIQIHRHDYRGLVWYIIEDASSGRHHRFNPAAYHFIGLLDGKLTVQEVFVALTEQLGDNAPSQTEIIQLLGQLNSADLIRTNKQFDTEDLFERKAKINFGKLQQRLANPVSQKLPLWDPDNFLNQHLNKVSWLLNTKMALLWLVIIAAALLMAAQNWPKISHHFDVIAFAPYNFLILFLLYPLIKVLHELGHAFVTKINGGEVHEIGINFLLFLPVPYVNVSSASHFRDKYDRMLVSAAGIVVESFLAALGLFVFLKSEPGLVQNISFNIMLTGGVSSLFFNGNPLLKYDGYYVLADMLEIPNLYQRAAHYWRYLFKRYLFGLKHLDTPATATGEPFWFLVYGLAAFLYRLSILWFICVYVTDKFFFLGVLLAIWLASIQILVPVYKALAFVLADSTLAKTRTKALSSTIALAALIIGLLGFMPMSAFTLTEGVVWLPDEAQIKAEQDGFIGELLINPTQQVQKGQIIAYLSDESLASSIEIASAKVNELQSQYRAQRQTDQTKSTILKESLLVAQAELAHLTTKAQTMAVKANKSGTLLLPEADDLAGRFIQHGEVIGYVLDDSKPTIRMVVSQDHIGQLRNRILEIKVRLANSLNQEYDANIIRQAPEATNKLPSEALAVSGGGVIQTSSEPDKQPLSLQKYFLVDLQFNSDQKQLPIGLRAYIRINHGSEPLASQWYRSARQVFLRQFNV